MKKPVRINTPLTDDVIRKLRIGQKVLISGLIYTARDTVHKWLCEMIRDKRPLPIDLRGQVIFYAGPAPTKPGYLIGPIGPTTSGRCDRYTPVLLSRGLKGMIGKGSRSEEVKKSIKERRAIYFAVTGGAASLIARCVKKIRTVAFAELGPEAMNAIEVKDMPAIVAIDCRAEDLYESGPKIYRKNDKKEKK